MRRVLARSILTGALAASLLAGAASAHECYVASRSLTGDIAAGSHSKVWLTVATLGDLVDLTGQFFGLPALTPDQRAWAVAQAEAAGLPEVFTIFVGNHVIAEGTPAMEMHSTDGKGIDHAFDWLPIVAGIYQQALSH